MSLSRAEFPHSRFERRFVWTWLTTTPVLAIWAITAWKGGDQWGVATAYITLCIFVWTVPTAEQVANMIKAAGVLKQNPLDAFGWNGSAAPAPKVEDES